MIDKVVYVVNARIPTEKAHGKQIVKTCEALAKSGVSLQLWIPNRRQTPLLKGMDPQEYYGSQKNFTIRKFWTWDWLIPAAKFPSPFQLFFYGLQETTFDLSVLTHFQKGVTVYSRSLSAALLIKLFWQTPTFYEAHNLSQSAFFQRLWAVLMKRLDGVVVISSGLGEALRNLGLQKILLAPDGVELCEFQGDRTHLKFERISPNQKIVLYAGRMATDKGTDTLLAAANNLKKEGIVFVFLTNNPVLTKSNLNVVFLPHVSPTEVADYLKSAAVLVLPNSAQSIASRTYTSPLKLFEYMASGKPIVASATPAIMEVLQNNKNAILVMPDDPDDLSRGILKVIKNPKLARKISTQAKNDARRYTWENRAQRIIAFLKSS